MAEPLSPKMLDLVASVERFGQLTRRRAKQPNEIVLILAEAILALADARALLRRYLAHADNDDRLDGVDEDTRLFLASTSRIAGEPTP